RIIKAQTARGAKYTEKGFKNRLTAISSIIIPLLVSSLRKAEELSLALRARKYGMNPRTHYYELNWDFADTVYLSTSLALFLLTLYVG
ncbi:MAG TPA: energy-coupling factor transporter transmembrane component T, partial [Fervidobacterium sp.]|nr:energy-coupling factor transporter transmembrane component T [Fervidobacterium sp.]